MDRVHTDTHLHGWECRGNSTGPSLCVLLGRGPGGGALPETPGKPAQPVCGRWGHRKRGLLSSQFNWNPLWLTAAGSDGGKR